MSENDQINLSDLNVLALDEFIKLIKKNEELDSRWRDAILELVRNGIPQDLDGLEALIGGHKNVENKAS